MGPAPGVPKILGLLGSGPARPARGRGMAPPPPGSTAPCAALPPFSPSRSPGLQGRALVCLQRRARWQIQQAPMRALTRPRDSYAASDLPNLALLRRNGLQVYPRDVLQRRGGGGRHGLRVGGKEQAGRRLAQPLRRRVGPADLELLAAPRPRLRPGGVGSVLQRLGELLPRLGRIRDFHPQVQHLDLGGGIQGLPGKPAPPGRGGPGPGRVALAELGAPKRPARVVGGLDQELLALLQLALLVCVLPPRTPPVLPELYADLELFWNT